MGFPDRIERSLDLAHPPAKVWDAAHDVRRSVGVVRRQSADSDAWKGAAQMRFKSGLTVDMRVERVEEPAVFGFTWSLPGPAPRPLPDRCRVHPGSGGGARGRESTGFAQLPDDTRRETYDSHAEGWTSEIGELVAYLDGA